MDMKRILILVMSTLLVACAAEDEDIQSWMAEQERGMRGAVKPLPEVKPFPAVEYDADSLVEPFASSRIEPESRGTVTGGPDLERQREPLEAYPLESLTMVGVLMQDERVHALVKADQVLHQVRVGNYLGQNHGVVQSITEAEVTLNEIVEDINGDWVERTSRLLLQEQ